MATGINHMYQHIQETNEYLLQIEGMTALHYRWWSMSWQVYNQLSRLESLSSIVQARLTRLALLSSNNISCDSSMGNSRYLEDHHIA